MEAARLSPPRTGPLSAANVGFHETYDRLVRATLARLGTSVPVIALIEDDLILLDQGRAEREAVRTDAYHRLKSFGHLIFGMYLSLMDLGREPLPEATRHELQSKLDALQGAARSLTEFSDEERPVLDGLLRHASALLESTLSAGPMDRDRLEQQARAVRPLLRENMAAAIGVELDRIHETVSRWRAQIGETRWPALFVVICGSHQPRYRDSARQYFGRLLHEPEGIGAEREDRIIYGEGTADVDEALDLLARHLIDQSASTLLFGDKRHLQADLLADVAAEHLDRLLPESR